MKAYSHSFAHITQGTWGCLMKNDAATKRIRDIVEEGMKIEMGDGSSIRFWYDNWCPSSPLNISFPRMFSTSLQREDYVSQMGEWVDEAWRWNLSWRRNLFDWETEDLNRLYTIIENFRPHRDKHDGVSWHGIEGKKFPIMLIVSKVNESSNPLLPPTISRFIWSLKIPPRAQIIIWMACLERLKTGDILVEKGGLDPAHALCPFCSEVMESNSHIFFTCYFSWSIWMHVLNWWGTSGVLQNKCADFILAWMQLSGRRGSGKLWKLILGCVLWSIWYERNKIKFEHGTTNASHMLYTLRVRVGIWAKEMLGHDLPSTSAWIC